MSSVLEPGTIFYIETRKRGWIAVRLETFLTKEDVAVVRGVKDQKLRTVKRTNLYAAEPTFTPIPRKSL